MDFELRLLSVRAPTGDGLEFKVGGDGAISGAKKALPTGTTRNLPKGFLRSGGWVLLKHSGVWLLLWRATRRSFQ
eukprot:scaffold126248_cov18-Tisochrysis_lutea.AAC.1